MKRLFKQFGVCLGFLMLAQSVHAVPIFNNLSHAFFGYSPIQADRWMAARTNVGANALSIDNLVVKIASIDASAPLSVRVCADSAGAPDMGTCVPFTAAGPIPVFSNPASFGFGDVSYSGSFAAEANEEVWIVLSTSTSGTGRYGWSVSQDDQRIRSFSSDGGNHWSTYLNAEVLYSISGTSAAPAAPVPTLSEWAMFTFAIAIAGFGICQLRRRES